MIKVKICGITNLEDALLATELGAHALGFVFYEKSKRFIEPEEAKKIIDELPPFVLKVGVFVHKSLEIIDELRTFLPLDRVQIYEDVPGLEKNIVIRAVRIKQKKDIEKVERIPYFPLLDSYTEGFGGSGKRFDWSLLQGLKRPYILAGGINLENLDEVMKLKPYAIDVATGLEESPGKKDGKKMKMFFERLRGHE